MNITALTEKIQSSLTQNQNSLKLTDLVSILAYLEKSDKTINSKHIQEVFQAININSSNTALSLTVKNAKILSQTSSYIVIQGEGESLLGIVKFPIKLILEQANNKLEVVIFITLDTKEWKFTTSFPDLPTFTDFSSEAEKESFLNNLGLQNPYFIISTYKHNYRDNTYKIDNENKVLAIGLDNFDINEGLNFGAKVDLSGPLDPAQKITQTHDNLIINGTIKNTGTDQEIGLNGRLNLTNAKFGPLKLNYLEIGISSGLKKDSKAQLTGKSEIQIGENFTLHVNTTIPVGYKGPIALEGDLTKKRTLPSLNDLQNLMQSDQKIDSYLPETQDESQSFGKLLKQNSEKGLGIQEFKLIISPDKGRIEYAKVILGTGDVAWKLLGDSLAIRGITMQLELLRFLHDSKKFPDVISLEIAGLLEIGDDPKDGRVVIMVAAEDLKNPKNINLSGRLIEGDKINIRQLIDKIGHSYIEVPKGEKGKDLSIYKLNLYGNPYNKYFSFDLGIESICEFEIAGGKKIALKSIEMRIDSAGNGYISGNFDIAGVEVYAGATHTSGGGWEFRGGTSSLTPIPLGAMLKELFKQELPPILEGLEIKELGMTFNTSSKDFSFVTEIAFPLAPKPKQALAETTETENQAILSLNTHVLHSSKNNEKSTEIRFDGNLLIAKRMFDVTFSHKENNNLFLALYNNPNGDTIKISDLITQLFADAPDFLKQLDLEISLNNAIIAFSSIKENGATTTKALFGIEIGAGLNLSDLPLIGRLFSREETLSMVFNLLAATEKFSEKEIDTINKSAPEGTTTLPEKELEKIRLSTIIRIGNETIELDLIDQKKKTSITTEDFTEAPKKSKLKLKTAKDTKDAIAETSNLKAQWIDVQKSFGPVNIERVGAGLIDKAIWLLLDGGFTAAGLTIDLVGLAVSFDLKDLTKEQLQKGLKPHFHLSGLGVDFKSGKLEIGAAFLRRPVENQQPGQQERYEFDGMAVIKYDKLNLTALGSYTTLEDGQASMFIYAILDYPIGGPPFFFVTGLAAGFGYNRSIIVPGINEISSFPLVAAAIDIKNAPKKPAQILKQLQNTLKPAVGEYFLALGIKFTSFKIIDSFALLLVKFGQHFEIDILGLSTLTTPGEKEGMPPLAEVHLVLKAAFVPEEGFLGVQAQITPDSYVLSKDCHITGGFAFFSWFAGVHKDDFVLTLGGYHKDFKVPDHYPQVPRLGLNWQVSKEFHVKAEAYFALVPSALMVGGRLEATWESGALKAWFIAGVDFLIAWLPYHYDARFYINIGASYTFEVLGFQKTITADLGADLHIWGPEFAGKAHIDLTVISFDVAFGEADSQKSKPIEWEPFKKSFLPDNNTICNISIQDGLVKQADQNDSENLGVINPKEFSLITNSAIPLNQAEVGGKVLIDKTQNTVYFEDKEMTKPNGFQINESGTEVSQKKSTNSINITAPGIGPMDLKASDLATTHKITIIRKDDSVNKSVEYDFSFLPVLKNVPAGMWGESVNPDLKKDPLVKNTLAGFEIRPKATEQVSETETINTDALGLETELVQDLYEWETGNIFELEAKDDDQRRDVIKTNIFADKTRATRNEMLEAMGIDLQTIDLTEAMAEDFIIAPEVGKFKSASK